MFALPYTRTRIKSEQVRTEPVITGLLPKYRGVETGPRVDVAHKKGKKKNTLYKSVFELVLFIYGFFLYIDIFARLDWLLSNSFLNFNNEFLI